MPHIHELYDFVAVATITYGDRVLMIHHIKLDAWLQGVGGHIDLDEDPEEALYREIEEESGLKREDLEMFMPNKRPLPSVTEGKQIPPPHDLHVHAINDTHQHISLNYFFRSRTDKLVLAPKEHHDIRWMDRAELDRYKDQMPNNCYEYALYALELAQEAA